MIIIQAFVRHTLSTLEAESKVLGSICLVIVTRYVNVTLCGQNCHNMHLSKLCNMLCSKKIILFNFKGGGTVYGM